MLDDVMVLEPSIIHHFMVEFRSGILKTWYRKSWSISPSGLKLGWKLWWHGHDLAGKSVRKYVTIVMYAILI